MIYRIYVDGKEKEAEVRFKKYSREADNRAREEIIRHYLEEEAAAEVRIGSAEKISLHCHTKMSGGAALLSPKELVRQAYEDGYKAVAITDCGNVQAFPECYMEWKRLWDGYKEKCSADGKEAVLQDFLKLIYGLEGKLLTEEGKIFPILIYAKNETGLRNLYRIVTASYLQYFENDTALIPSALLDKYREGLMLASADDGVPDTVLSVCEEDSICREILTGWDRECSSRAGTYEIPGVKPESRSFIAGQAEYISPLREGRYLPEYPDADKELRKICEEQLKELFGGQSVPEAADRLERELKAVCENGYAGLYMMWRQLVSRSYEKGYPVGARGAVGSSFIAYLCGISEVNPLSYEAGGYDIPAEIFMGAGLDREPDIDLIFAEEIQAFIQNSVKDLPGVGETCYGGTVSLISERKARLMTEEYFIKNASVKRDKKTEKAVVEKLTGVKRCNGHHPGGIIVCPRGEELLSFTPLTLSNPGQKQSTMFDYHYITPSLLKMDILGSDSFDLLHFLQENTKTRIDGISLDDKKTLKLICDTDMEKIDKLPEFGSGYVRRIIAEMHPVAFEDLIRICALAHGSGIWYENQEEMIRNKLIKAEDCITSADDIMLCLIGHGMERKAAYEIMQTVRKGRGLSSVQKRLMRKAGIEQWYMDVCEKADYIFPKAHAVSAAMTAVRLAYYMVHYPEVYEEGLSAVS